MDRYIIIYRQAGNRQADGQMDRHIIICRQAGRRADGQAHNYLQAGRQQADRRAGT